MSEYDSGEESEDSDTARPNRYTGPPSTWQSWTEQERGLTASLNQLRDQDLSVHLYNAHALKARARAYARLKEERASQAVSEPENDDEAQRSFVPPKSWTAWPLPPHIVPREGEHVGPEDQDEIYTLKRRERKMPSHQLEEVLVGVTLKCAKERFELREWDEEDLREDVAEDTIAREKGIREPGRENPMDISTDSPLDEGHLASDSVLKKSSEPPPEKALLKPVVSADDERSRELLRPSIRHTLSKLDEVLMALHYARRTCREYTARSGSQRADSARPESGVSDSDELERKATTPKRRPRGRPRKHTNLPGPPQVDEGSKSSTVENPELWRSKPTRLGRPRKQYPRLDGENEQDYLIRVARLQKKPLPPFAPPRELETPDSPRSSPPKKTPRKNLAPENAKVRHEKHLGLRDWSEVLGSAALVGFSPEVIARATQRCANLFGENMTMRTIVEAPFAVENGDMVNTYKPEGIPEMDTEVEETIEISSDDESESNDSVSESSSSESQPWTMGSRKPKGPAAKQENYFCPLEECPRHMRGFSKMTRLSQHLKKGHKMTPDEMDDILFGGSNEVEGAVHVDGWLKPLKGKRGVRGKDMRKRKMGRWGSGVPELESESGSQSETESSDSDDSLTSEESGEE